MRRYRLSVLVALSAIGSFACGDDSIGVNQTADGSDSTAATLDSTGTDGTGSESIDETAGESDAGTMAGSTCDDGIQNGMETDVDCGGPQCDACEDGTDCDGPEDCESGVCENGECQPATCYDMVQNGDEEGVDCGADCPNFCVEDPPCDNDNDCEDGEFCEDGECFPSACDNDIQDSQESDVDCGGPVCPDCPPGSDCFQDSDCDSGVCEDGTCADPTCDDNVQNGDETDTDCGGSCDACPNGADCLQDDDCISEVCENNVCVDDECDDNVQNGQETDVDCGGPECAACMDDADCTEDDDCVSGVCENDVCQAPECDDLVENGDETDLDCGNSCGATCEVGEGCDSGDDCVEMVCEFNVCSLPDCDDGEHNGDETDQDCGGPQCDPCDSNDGCVEDDDCESGVCENTVCQPPMCDDLVENGDETDVDCGNSCLPLTCATGEGCDSGDDCDEGVCSQSVCQAPTCDDGVQNGAEGGVDCLGTCPKPCSIGGEVLVNSTTADFQTAPAVAVSPNGNNWVVVWMSTPAFSPPQDGDGSGIFAQIYDSLGNTVGAELPINTVTTGDQAFPDVAASNAGFVVVWQTEDLEGTGVSGQRYDWSGTPLSVEFPVNQTTDEDQRRPSIGMDGSGNFVTCWDSFESTTFEVYCRRFAGDTTPSDDEFQVNTSTGGDEQLPVVARDSAGNFTVAWQGSNDPDLDGSAVLMRRFDNNQNEVTAETVVNTVVTAGDQSEPAIAMNASGAFTIVWTSEGSDAEATGIAAQKFLNTGAVDGGEFNVNSTGAGAQQRPSVAMSSDGDVFIAWQTADDGNTTGVFGQRYDDAGALLGVEFIVNPTIIGRQEEPDVAIRLDSELVNVWSDADLTTSDIRMQRYSSGF